MRTTRATARTIAIAGAVGVVSGVASHLFPQVIGAVGIDKSLAFVEWLLRLWPGIIFGVAIGLYLKLVGATTSWRAAGFVPLETAAWYAALWFAINGPKKLGFPFEELWQRGIAAGLIGAGLVALSALLLFPFFRHWKLVAAMIVAGGVLGALVPLGLIILFPVWQGAVAACFGWAVARAGDANQTGRAL